MSDKVATLHPKYKELAKRRKIYRDVVGGTLAMRAGKREYLPQFPAEEDASWEVRLNTATLFNMLAKTQEVMTGMVFNKPLTLNDDVPTEIAGTETTPGLVENFDNRGNHMNLFFQYAFLRSFEGAVAILTDAPNVKADSKADERQVGLRPYGVMYEADAVINWFPEFNPVTQAREFTLIVLKEITAKLDGFEVKPAVMYRVFRKVSGIVSWELYEERHDDKTKKSEIVLIDQATTQLTQIPVEIIGDLEGDAPLMDLALKNIEHYQAYSDYRSLQHKTCVPMFYTVNVQGETPEHIGGDVHWNLGDGGSAAWAEVSGSSLTVLRESLEDMKMDMAKLGLSMLAAKPDGDITATEALLNSIQETSGLQLWARQLENAIENTLGHMAVYLGKGQNAGGSVELGATWAEMVVGNEQLAQFNQMVNDGNLSIESLLWTLEKGGYLPPDVTAEEELARITQFDNEGLEPLALGAGGGTNG